MELNCLRKNNAFSLLEILIAVAVLSVGIVTVLQALSYCARITGLSCDMVRATFLAEDKIQELEFKEKQGLIEDEPAQVNDKTGKYEWGYTISADSDSNLYILNFNIAWQRSNRDEELNLNTYLR